ncbi:Uncharacterized membrane protein [Pollutimonas bauzanensis]|uniref:Uncharacterized membrane protein n=1 Tax=Pollutimonas bauzanensis TaxID=658167 RepID=A0A1M5PZJ9_9BURK|nr:DUF2231 domain-containing protein [Pollutimonas bauzanensis]SHH07112.1 Uncharacterized membrane protein [Pollutimonas bauzanensis]
MPSHARPSRFRLSTAIFDLLDPIPFGFFVAALIFDIVYAYSPDVLWGKGAAWLISIGLLFAIIPRLINLAHVWFIRSRPAAYVEKIDFWLNLIAIAAAIVNAFVHTRDAYAVIPQGIWLSAFTVVLLSVGKVVLATQKAGFKEFRHE